MFELIAVIDTTVQVTVITTVGLIIVAIIGIFSAKVTSDARDQARLNANDASMSARVAKDYVAALKAKDALIASLEERITELERKVEENAEQQRSSALIERAQCQEIDELQTKLAEFKSH